MPILKPLGVSDDQLQNAIYASAVQTHAAAIVTITAPASGFTFIPFIFAGYTGAAGPFNLTIIPATVTGNSYLYAITGIGGEIEMNVGTQYDASAGTVTITLPDGGVGIVGILIVGYFYL